MNSFGNLIGDNQTFGLSNNGTDTNVGVSKFAIHPNPVMEQANMQLDLVETSEVEITVQAMNGAVLKEIQYGTLDAGRNNVNLDFSGFRTGVYFVSVRTGDSYETTRVVVTK